MNQYRGPFRAFQPAGTARSYSAEGSELKAVNQVNCRLPRSHALTLPRRSAKVAVRQDRDVSRVGLSDVRRMRKLNL